MTMMLNNYRFHLMSNAEFLRYKLAMKIYKTGQNSSLHLTQLTRNTETRILLPVFIL